MSPIAGALFSSVTYPLSLLISSIEIGQIALPDLQRPFVWSDTKARDLLDSMYKGYPVGHLLFWVCGDGTGHKKIGSDGKQVVPSLLIVDGQQRLTSLYAVVRGAEVLRSDYSRRRITISFCPLTGQFEVATAATRQNPDWIANVSDIWSPGVSMFDTADGYVGRLRETRECTKAEEAEAKSAIARIQNLLNYSFTAMQLSHALDEEQVADIFVRTNSKGTTLNQADFILTLMSVYWDDGRKQLEAFCRECRVPSASAASPYNWFIKPLPVQLLRAAVAYGFRRARLEHVYSLLRGKDLDTGEFSDERREAQFDTLKMAEARVLDLVDWHDFLICLRRAGVCGASMITSETTLLYCYSLYLIGKHDLKVASVLLRNAIARWYFMAALTQRYTASPESAMEADLALLRNVTTAAGFVDTLDRAVRDVLSPDFWAITLPNALAASSARTPSLYAYYAALNILDARALFSTIKIADLLDPTVKAPKSGVERHHLFPRGYLERIRISERRDINQIANYAWVEWADNIEISDKAPSEYFPSYHSRFNDKMAYWHALPDGWENMPYGEFLEKRRHLMAQVVKDAFERLWESA